MEALPRSGQLTQPVPEQHRLRGVTADVPAHNTWQLAEMTGTAEDLHGCDLAEVAGGQRLVAVFTPNAPALVLGSTQSGADVDVDAASAAGIDVVRRRSGGGAVWLHPSDSVWIDVWLPRGDSLWTDDVSASMLFLGEAFAAVLADFAGGEDSVSVWRGRFEAGGLGRTVCFASLAPGEVLARPSTTEGKVVGISQRRDRRGARFQCVLYRRWQPADWARFFVDPAVRRGIESIQVMPADLDSHDVAVRLMESLSGS